MIQEHRQASEPKQRIDTASPADLVDYRELLARAGLPPEGLAECLPDALVARRDGLLQGAVALETYGDQALLRSLVVAPATRGGGLGGALVDAALALARRRGVATVYLLTETAAPFFAHRGFATLARADVPTAVQESVQFRSVCPQSAIAMTLALATNHTTSSATQAPQSFAALESTHRSVMTSTTIAPVTTDTSAKTCCGPDCCGGTKSETTAAPTKLDAEQLVAEVRARYGAIAATSGSCCGPVPCGASTGDAHLAVARGIGYSDAELASLPEGANLGLGCGAPLAALAPQPGETVLDLGSGAGMDVFLAAESVGPRGRVLGVDMTPEMLERARGTATKLGFSNVEFRSCLLYTSPSPRDS